MADTEVGDQECLTEVVESHSNLEGTKIQDLKDQDTSPHEETTSCINMLNSVLVPVADEDAAVMHVKQQGSEFETGDAVNVESQEEMIEIQSEAGQILVPASMAHIIHNSDLMAILQQAASMQPGSATSLTIEMEEGKATKIHSVSDTATDVPPVVDLDNSDEVLDPATGILESKYKLDPKNKVTSGQTMDQISQSDCEVEAVTPSEKINSNDSLSGGKPSETYVPHIKVLPSTKKPACTSGQVVEIPITGPSHPAPQKVIKTDDKEVGLKSATSDACRVLAGGKSVGPQEQCESGRKSPQVIEIKPTETKVTPDVDDDIVTVSVTRGRPKRKASFGVAALTRELGRKRSRYDTSPIEEPIVQSQPAVKRGKGRPRKYPLSPSAPNTAKEGKENRPLLEEPVEKQPVMVNIIVKDKTILPYVNNMGIYMMFYCRNCTYFGRSMLTVADHIANCKGTPISPGSLEESLANATLETAALKEVFLKEMVAENRNKDVDEPNKSSVPSKAADHALSERKEHSYATAEIHFEDSNEKLHSGNATQEELGHGDDTTVSTVKDKKPVIENIPGNRKWFCPECHYTFFHSDTEFEIHKKCHGRSGKGDIHCYICFRKKKEDWHRLKGHLYMVHKINFNLKCGECEEVYAAHVDYNKHCSAHKKKCKFDFCRFESQNSSDMDTHEKCHVNETPKHFRCFSCGYQCRLRPHKWSTMHAHLVTRHHGIIEPLYKCEDCGKGFQEIRRYSAHVKICRKGNPISFKEECKFCGKSISSIHMERHLKTHLADAQNVEKAETSKEVNKVSDALVGTSKLSSVIEGDSVGCKKIPNKTEPGVEVDFGCVPRTSQRHKNGQDHPVTLSKRHVDNFFCQKHSLYFDSQEMLTKHLVEVHWEVTPEKVVEAQERKKEIQRLMAEVRMKKAERAAQRALEREIPSSLSKKMDEDLKTPVEVYEEVEEHISNATALPTIGDDGVAVLQIKQEALASEMYDRGDDADELNGVLDSVDAEELQDKEKILCVECNKEFDCRISFRNHYRMAHSARKRKDVNAEQVRCSICYKKFSSHERLDKHTRRVHTVEKMKPVLCQICGRGYRNRVQFRNHYRVVHEGIKRRKPAVPYKRPTRKYFICETCGYTTPEAIRLRNHQLAIHEGLMPYQCEMCNYKTSEKSDMRRHKQKHMGIKRHCCQFCPYRTNQRWLLVTHCLKQHSYQMPKVKRDTRGCYWSNSNARKPDKVEIVKYEPTETVEINGETMEIDPGQFGQEHVIAILPEAMTNVGEFTHIVAEQPTGSILQEQQVAVEMIEADTSSGEVVYVHEDGTLLEPAEQAALMLLAVAPVTSETNQIM